MLRYLYKAYLGCCDFVRKSEWVGIFKLFKRYNKRSIFTQSNVELASTFMLEFTESVFIFIVNVLSRFTGLPTTKARLTIHHGHLKYGLWINASVKSYLFWRVIGKLWPYLWSLNGTSNIGDSNITNHNIFNHFLCSFYW